jgi:hypothetical protein
MAGNNPNSFIDKVGSFAGKFGKSAAQATGIGQNPGAVRGLQSIIGDEATKRLGFDLAKGGAKPYQPIPGTHLATIDNRVKIKIHQEYLQGPAAELQKLGGVVFPFTPQIVVTTRANYTPVHPTHSNYQFQAYQNSQLDALSIVGTFTAQNTGEARMLLGSVHALRTITKMHFGSGANVGAPPPVVRLSGYGEYMFNDMPVVIGNFFYTLNEDVDYIDVATTEGAKTTVPTRAEFTVECMPAFSRRDQATFSMQDYAQGNMRFKGMI